MPVDSPEIRGTDFIAICVGTLNTSFIFIEMVTALYSLALWMITLDLCHEGSQRGEHAAYKKTRLDHLEKFNYKNLWLIY